MALWRWIMAGKKKYVVRLSDEEIHGIRGKLKKKGTSDTVANRCRILLDVDENQPSPLTQEECAKKHGISRATVSNTVANYCKNGLETTLTLKRNINSDNSRRKMDGRAEARLITLACSAAPEGHSRWTIRLLEREAKVILDEPVSRETIRRTLKKTNYDLTAATTGVCRPKPTPNL